MQVPITIERETLDDLLRGQNWKAIESFGIRNLKQEPSTSDCGHYVLDIIGVPSNLEMIEALQQLPVVQNAPKEGLILYRAWGAQGLRTMHYGIVAGETVRSKWGPDSPVFEHPLLLVPAIYGSAAVFCTMKKAREYFMERRQQTMFGPDYY